MPVASTCLLITASAACEDVTNVCTSLALTAWFSAYAVGTVPIKISMISPMPFCPSLLPCAKLTPEQVKISKARIGHGGGALPFGAVNSTSALSITILANTATRYQPMMPTMSIVTMSPVGGFQPAKDLIGCHTAIPGVPNSPKTIGAKYKNT